MPDLLDELPPEPPAWNRARGIPAWVFSFGLHFCILIALGMSFQPTPRGVGEETSRQGGIVLVHRAAGQAQYFTEDDGSDAPAGAMAAIASGSPARTLTTETFDPQRLTGPQLPTASGELVGSEPPGSSSVPGANSLTQGNSGTKGGPLGRGHVYDVETKVFGVAGRGSRFVYVFDRSASMDGYEGRPLAAAKRELVASLHSLQSVHQFQILFYNENPQLMNLFRGLTPGLVFGDDQSKRLAEQYVGSIYADGGTAHMKALSMALKLNPDVIFFLTDADEPQLRPDELASIRRLNHGTIINAIEFGSGPSAGRRNFLTRLAEENDGQHTYVDVTQLPRGR